MQFVNSESLLDEKTQKEVANLVKTVLDDLSTKARRSLEEVKKAKPFHSAFLTDETILHGDLASSVETTVGTRFLPAIAEIVAKGRYSEVHREYEILADLDSAKVTMVDTIVNSLRSGMRKPNHLEEMREIMSVSSSDRTSVRIIADLYVGDHEDGPLFMEIKAPLPNLDQCAESKRKMLLFLVVNEGKQAQAFLGLTYNPYVERHLYKWSFTKRIMDMEKEVLIGKEMWDKLGGAGTFEAILRTIKEASDEWRKSKQQQTKLF